MSNLDQQQQAVSGELEEVRRRIRGLEGEQAQIEGKLADLARDAEEHQLLAEISEKLARLEEMGRGDMFWADDYSEIASRTVLERAQRKVNVYHTNVEMLEERRRRVQEEIEDCEEEILYLDERAEQLRRAEEEARFEFEVTRELELSDSRVPVMPWHKQSEDDQRFRRCVLISLLLALFLGYTIPMWTVPEPEDEVVEIPERLAKLVIEKKKKPKPPPEPEQPKKKDEKKPEPKKEKVAKEEPKPSKIEKKQARKKAERSGVLAFKDNFQDLIEDDLDNRLGERTQLSTAGKKENASQRSLITAAAKSDSGGIASANISRNVGGTGSSMEGVAFSRVESSIGSEGDFAGEERPLSDGAGPSRTDEEIQIVFDRYKASLYRIYNRELRMNPALQGKMVLKITIEPDGSVSAVSVESSDMDSPTLNSKITARVKRFNFGPKAGVPTITILYPIDFLPAG
ncbi:AgmX/PglI C-terminal domain-containing protein [Microbulbifer yueqingensis]|uniref:TonB family C-terminal domain-containing protein n=1 Tax=Microbulbifer yueqingensis TaxID=658219 RepID=A0A1G8XJX8_9GAMM|nr:AgmX/PglI C-terminal domain-containing protein [Microbulbifer yueqingensis]SDJ90952.1 TonB family C-terminal domain-containing protein [Microbulbifer yueqingensis]